MMEKIFSELEKEFPLILDVENSSENVCVIRSSISTEEEINNFVKRYSQLSNTCWIVYFCRKNLNRWIFSKSWKCQHSSHRKRQNSPRCLDCKASISANIKKITADTKKKDRFLRMEKPMVTTLTLQLCHTHLLNVPDSLNFMRIPEEVKQQFFEYFDDGLTPTAARSFHADLLLASENFIENVSNAAINPTQRQILNLYDSWRSRNLGPSAVPFEKLQDKTELYAEKGAKVICSTEEFWSVLIVTAVMQRAHKLQCSSEIIFVDTTSSCESTGSSLTILLSATKVGAVPIAAIIHENQTTQSYMSGFALLKREFPLCFGNTEAPSVFMTDDSKAERKALEETYPSSMLLLCHFHVAQAEWRWLHSCKDVDILLKPVIMKLFQAVMYATSEETLLAAYQNLRQATSTIPSYCTRIEKYFQRRKEWTTVDRQNLLIRGHNTNNFAEASIRILKDVVLYRTKAYNVVALVDFFVTVWENHLILKLLDFANGRRTPMYRKFIKNLDIPADSCVKIDDNFYTVPSSKEGSYLVNVKIGTCTCVSGRTGAFCKHQFYLQDKLAISLPTTPFLDETERHKLAMLALGDKCPPSSFYRKITDVNGDEDFTPMDTVPGPSTSDNMLLANTGTVQPNLATDAEKEKLLEEFKKLLDDKSLKRSAVERLTNCLRNTNNSAGLTLTRMAYSVQSRSSRVKKIKVQPTSICRRRCGTSRTTNRIQQGRPVRVKRKHALFESINKNINHAKKHS